MNFITFLLFIIILLILSYVAMVFVYSLIRKEPFIECMRNSVKHIIDIFSD